MTKTNTFLVSMLTMISFAIGGCAGEAVEPGQESLATTDMLDGAQGDEAAATREWWTCKGDATMQYDQPWTPIDRAQGFLVTGGGGTKRAAETSTLLVLQNKATGALREGETKRGWSYMNIYGCYKN